jgi:enoyl-CoA hydratase/carnithine racemase
MHINAQGVLRPRCPVSDIERCAVLVHRLLWNTQEALNTGRIQMARKKLLQKRVSVKDRIAWLTLNRPEKKNALNQQLMDELISALRQIRDNREIRCIVIAAAGDAFCAGMDLHELGNRHKTPHRWDQGDLRELLAMMRSCPQITIASVQGYCLGGGMVIVNGCELAVAANDAQIGMPEIIRGSYGAVATPTLFQSGVPAKTAFRVQLTGKNLTGEEAARVGLVSHAVPAGEVRKTVVELAHDIASRHPAALEHAKLSAYAALDSSYELALKTDEYISHRLRIYADPTGHVDGYLKSQKGGGTAGYVKPDAV